MKEIWSDVPTFEGRYQVSSLGRVRSNRGVLQSNPAKGQKVVSIVTPTGTKVYEIRHLMAFAFLGADINSDVKPKLIHKDGDFHNIHLDNLELADYSDLQGEEWRDIDRFEGVYQVSNLGRVKRLPYQDTYVRSDTGVTCTRNYAEKIIKLTLSKDGYAQVNLVNRNNNVYATVHRLVAQAFIPNPNNLPQINHIDGVRNNNHVDNLEWCTAEYNVQDQIVRSGRDACISAIRQIQGRSVTCLDTNQVFDSIGQAARELGCDNGAITSSIERRSCCFGWTFIYTDEIDSLLDVNEYIKETKDKYFKWPRARIKEVPGWKNMYFQVH